MSNYFWDIHPPAISELKLVTLYHTAGFSHIHSSAGMTEPLVTNVVAVPERMRSWIGYLTLIPALLLAGLMLGSLALFMSSVIKQLENFAGVMNFVIFPMFFASSALYPLWRIREASPLLFEICRLNPFTYAVELIRFALHGQVDVVSLPSSSPARSSSSARPSTPIIPRRASSDAAAARAARRLKHFKTKGPRMTWRLLSTSALALSLGRRRSAADKEHPDWPCLQKKVENLAASQVWDGPAIDGIKGWQDDEAISLSRACIRKTPPRRRDGGGEEICRSVFPRRARSAFDDRVRRPLRDDDRRAPHNHEGHREVQPEPAKTRRGHRGKGQGPGRTRSQGRRDEDAAEELAKAQEDYDWQTRIFKERNDNLPIACELPVLIDQRLFDLAKTIRGLMKS